MAGAHPYYKSRGDTGSYPKNHAPGHSSFEPYRKERANPRRDDPPDWSMMAAIVTPRPSCVVPDQPRAPQYEHQWPTLTQDPDASSPLDVEGFCEHVVRLERADQDWSCRIAQRLYAYETRFGDAFASLVARAPEDRVEFEADYQAVCRVLQQWHGTIAEAIEAVNIQEMKLVRDLSVSTAKCDGDRGHQLQIATARLNEGRQHALLGYNHVVIALEQLLSVIHDLLSHSESSPIARDGLHARIQISKAKLTATHELIQHWLTEQRQDAYGLPEISPVLHSQLTNPSTAYEKVMSMRLAT